MYFLRLNLISFILILFPVLATAQDASFGAHIGVSMVRIRYENAGPPPKTGWVAGGTAIVPIGQKALLRFMPQFGYLLSNVQGVIDPLNPIYSNLSGRPLGTDTDVRILTHMFQGAALLKLSNNSDDQFGLYAGPAIHQIINQTLILEYPVQGQDEKVQERISGFKDGADRSYWMLYLGAECRFSPPEKMGIYGYIQTYHQLNQDPLLPSGFSFGMKFLW